MEAKQHRVAAAITAAGRMKRLGAAQELAAIAEFADLYQVDPDALIPVLAERRRPVASQSVSEFAALELAGLLGCSPWAAGDRMVEALAVKYRHPSLFAAVQALTIEPLRAIRAASVCSDLAADLADQVTIVWLPQQEGMGFRAAFTLLDRLVIEADPRLAPEKAEASRRYRGVRLSGLQDGCLQLVGTVDVLDGRYFDLSLDRMAQILAAEYPDLPAQARRAKAVGILANPALALAMLQRAAQPELAQLDSFGFLGEPALLDDHQGGPARQHVRQRSQAAGERDRSPRLPIATSASFMAAALMDGPELEGWPAPPAGSAHYDRHAPDDLPLIDDRSAGEWTAMAPDRSGPHTPPELRAWPPPHVREPDEVRDRGAGVPPDRWLGEGGGPPGPGGDSSSEDQHDCLLDLCGEATASPDRPPKEPSVPAGLEPVGRGDPPCRHQVSGGTAPAPVDTEAELWERQWSDPHHEPSGHRCGTIEVPLHKLLPRLGLAVHIHADSLGDLTGAARIDRAGWITTQLLAQLLGDTQVSVQPVIDLANRPAEDQYVPTVGMKRAVELAMPTEMFPYSNRRAQGLDLDHSIRFTDGESGQTRLGNLVPLSRRVHRAKTAGVWRSRQLGPDTIQWTSPLGYRYEVTPRGTRRLE